MENNFEVVDKILQKWNYDKTKLIAIMQDIQAEYRYLPEDLLIYVSKQLKQSYAKVYGVATFYGNFSLEAKGKYVFKVCRGTACHVRKSDTVLSELYSALDLYEDKLTTDDGLFSIEIVNCLGACSLAPVVMVNEEVHANMNPEKVRELVKELKQKEGVE